MANMCACPTLLPFFVVSTGQHQSYAELHPQSVVPLQWTHEVPEQSASISQESKDLANEIRNWHQDWPTANLT